MAEALDDLIDDPVLARRLASGGQELAGASYDAERLADVLDEVYRSGLAAHALDMAG